MQWMSLAVATVLAVGCADARVVPDEARVGEYPVAIEASRGPWLEGDDGWMEVSVYDYGTHEPVPVVGDKFFTYALLVSDDGQTVEIPLEPDGSKNNVVFGEWTQPAAGTWNLQIHVGGAFTPGGAIPHPEPIADVVIE